MGALGRIRAWVHPAPAPSNRAAPSALIPVRLTRKYVVDGGPAYNAGEILGLSPAQAAPLLREGIAQRCSPTAQPDVRPRQDPDETWTYVGWSIDAPEAWPPK